MEVRIIDGVWYYKWEEDNFTYYISKSTYDCLTKFLAESTTNTPLESYRMIFLDEET